jgi:hypothetical protein
VKIYWTYSRTDLRPCDIAKHEQGKVRLSNDKYHVGGLNRMVPLFTHCICPQGNLYPLNYCPGNEIHLALIGGLNNDNNYMNTATSQQLLTLGNVCRFYLSLGEVIEEGDFSNFDLKLWLRAINK